MDGEQVVRGRVRRVDHVRVGHGLYRRRDVADPAINGQAMTGPAMTVPGRTEPQLADLVAWAEVLPPGGCFTHLTAAGALGLSLPPLPPGLPVWVSLPKPVPRLRRPELRVVRHTAAIAAVPVGRAGGVPVATAAEAVLACARDLSVLDLVVLADSALHLGRCTPEELVRLSTRDQWGAPRLRRALQYDDGRFVARGDLRLSGTRVLHEYDGAGHRDRRTHHADLARDRRLVSARWVRRGYTSTDLLLRAHLILREADDSLGRRHHPRRLQRWSALLRDSLFSSVGTRALLRRLYPPESGR